MPAESDGLLADVDAALVQEVFGITKRERESDVEHHRQADNLPARLEVDKGNAIRHRARLRDRQVRLNPISSDTA